MQGRVRLRVPKPRTAAAVRRIGRRIASSPRVRQVQVNETTGSLLLSFGRDDPIDEMLEELRRLGIEVLSMSAPVMDMFGKQSTSAIVVRRLMSGANRTLHAATKGSIDLRFAVPAAYTLLAARSFLRQRGRLRDASWYQLLYWAFDSFYKLHEESRVAEGIGTRGGSALN